MQRLCPLDAGEQDYSSAASFLDQVDLASDWEPFRERSDILEYLYPLHAPNYLYFYMLL